MADNVFPTVYTVTEGAPDTFKRPGDPPATSIVTVNEGGSPFQILRPGASGVSPVLLPVVANQAIQFGRSTRAGAGGIAPTNTGGTITSASIDSGTNAAHWQIASDGTISPSSAGISAGLSASYSLGVTLTNAGGSVSAVITINTEANALDVISGAELVAAAAYCASTSTSTAWKVYVRDGVNITDNAGNVRILISGKVFTGTVSDANEGASEAAFNQAATASIAGGGSLTLTCRTPLAGRISGGLEILGSSGITIDGVAFGHITSALNWNRNEVSDVNTATASSEYQLKITKNGTFTTPPEVVVKNCDFGSRKATTDSGYWATAINVTPAEHVVVEDCTFDGFYIGLSFGSVRRAVSRRNAFSGYRNVDCMRVFGNSSADLSSFTSVRAEITDNTAMPWVVDANWAQAHRDGLQIGTSADDVPYDVFVKFNRFFAEQGIYLDDYPSSLSVTGIIKNNFLSVETSNGLTSWYKSTGTLANDFNTIVKDTRQLNLSNGAPNIRISRGTGQSYTGNIAGGFQDTIVGAHTYTSDGAVPATLSDGTSSVTLAGNLYTSHLTANTGAGNSYPELFTGPFDGTNLGTIGWQYTIRTDTVAHFKADIDSIFFPKAASAAVAKGHTTTTSPDVTAPTITSPNTASVAENSAWSLTLTANEVVTWTKTGGADASLFTLAGSTLSLAAKDYESPTDANADNAYVVQVTATDGAGNATNQTITVTVTNVIETDPGVTAIRSTGWDIDFTSPPTMDPVNSPRYVIASRQGYDTAGATTTYTDNLKITTRVRQVYPNHASLDATRCALEDYIYSTDTISGVTNNSAEVSPKPIVNWAVPDYECVGATFPKELLEVVAFHRDARNGKQVACVVWTIADASGHSVTVTQATPVVSGRSTDKNAVVVYRPSSDVDLSTLTDGDVLTVNAKVYPWIGAAASVADSSTVTDVRGFSPRKYWKNVTRAAAPPIAYVALSGGSSSGVVSTTLATAKATPFDTIGNAIVGLKNASTSIDGCKIVLQQGTHTNVTNTAAATYQLGKAVVTITLDTSDGTATQANTIFAPSATGWTWRSFQFKLKGITYQRTGAFQASLSTANSRFVMEDVLFANGSQSSAPVAQANCVMLFNGVTVTNVGTSTFAAGTSPIGLFRGATAGVAGTAWTVEQFNVLGCNLTNPTPSPGTRTQDGTTFAFNKLLSFGSNFALGVSADVTGAAYVQNVMETITGASLATFRISADSATGNNTHVVIHNNTFAGAFQAGRWNVFYDEGPTRRTSKLFSVKGNIPVAIYTKSDMFVALSNNGTPDPVTAPSCTGNFAFEFGVACQGNVSQYMGNSAPGSAVQENQNYAGLGSLSATTNTSPGTNNPSFTTNAGATYNGTTYTAGAGGGDYHIGSSSIAKGIVSNSVLPFDLAGTARVAANGDAGAYKAA